MKISSKLQTVATEMHLEPAEEVGVVPRGLQVPEGSNGSGGVLPCGQVDEPQYVTDKREALGITQAVMPGGKRINLLKTMLTSACERNCYYCPFRAGRSYRRVTFKPEEMARAFMDMYRAGMVEGLFLSSGIIGGGATSQDKLIDTADILRNKLGFRGYVHLKVMPGSERDQVKRTMELASRVSVNLEAPNSKRLGLLAPKKVFIEELVEPLKWMQSIRLSESPLRSWNGRWASSATQFVVGAVGESDLELLTTSAYLYHQAGLARTYFSRFKPVPNTPLENQEPENPWREHRLYQASYLLRDYGFDLEELPFDQTGDLPLEDDPKMAWAQENLSHSPVEVNRAGREQLLRIPGIGHKGANAILANRRHNKVRELRDLKYLGVNPTRPAPFVLLDGNRPNYQLRLRISDFRF